MVAKEEMGLIGFPYDRRALHCVYVLKEKQAERRQLRDVWGLGGGEESRL